jgi:uridine kinase
MILVQEALQERRIGEIAAQIFERKNTKFVLVAGPSSSGKTTFSDRLAVQLRSFGLRPHIISMDNYFVNREKTPIDIDGNYNYDVIEALDIDLFNDDMLDLLEGETIELPQFDFKAGKRVYKGKYLKLGEDDILIIEGIHGLNPRSTEELPDENKFKIYISCMTSLNIDEHNRIPSTDARLLRRMVRDARTRGYTAQNTLDMWPNVRAGEDQNIFPFQDDADAVFNSVLIYELAVIKQFAEPLLFNVRQNEPEYYEAKRLLKFLEYFVGVDTSTVPGNSLLREFVGGSCFPTG